MALLTAILTDQIQFLDIIVLEEIMKLRVLVSKCEVTEFTRLGKAVMTTILQMTMDVALLVQKNKDGIEPIL